MTNPGSYRRFSCPQVAAYDWMEAIAVVHGVAALEMLIDRKRDEILHRSEGLLELLEGWLGSRTDFETVWDLSFGRIMRALESDEVDPVDVLVEVTMRLGSQGVVGAWSATLSEERRLCWAECWLLPTASQISLACDEASAAVKLTAPNGSRSSAEFRRMGQRWAADGVEQMIQLGDSRRITFLSAQAVPRDMIFEDDFHSIFEFPQVTSELVRPFSAALEIIGRGAPEYFGWVERVLRGILICRCQESRTRSSSWMHAPGVVLVSWSANPIEIAEMLVHECSHQYFYLLSRLGPVVDGSDTQHYYSPAVQRSRPLGKVLVGYHAFANILLFYRKLLRNGFAEDPYCKSMEARLSAEVEILEGPLRDNPALTAFGRDICEPLIERLSERGPCSLKSA